ncbi:hypothetical protein [Streptomyces sp. NPDC053048]|uniref:hypothetical protein n=1 Tax=Streptomyces sp. NPDC053048 TaxID=3365694 RepID=UPI0037D0744B
MSRTTEHKDEHGGRRARLLTGALAIAALLAALVALWQTQSRPLEKPEHRPPPSATAAASRTAVPPTAPASAATATATGHVYAPALPLIDDRTPGVRGIQPVGPTVESVE